MKNIFERILVEGTITESKMDIYGVNGHHTLTVPASGMLCGYIV